MREYDPKDYSPEPFKELQISLKFVPDPTELSSREGWLVKATVDGEELFEGVDDYPYAVFIPDKSTGHQSRSLETILCETLTEVRALAALIRAARMGEWLMRIQGKVDI